MYYPIPLILLLTVSGCGSDLRQNNAPAKHNHLEWDVSEDRDAAAFPWFDFDPDYGAIDDTTHLVFKFDKQRKFEGKVELVTFSRANDNRTSSSISPSQSPVADRSRNNRNASIACDFMESRY